MAEILCEARNVWRSFRRGREIVVAVAGASFQISAGERIAVVGRSGSGKTTLLNLMAGLDTPTVGEMLWPALGPAGSLRPGKVGAAFQAQSLLPALTSIENVELPVLLDGKAPEARDRALATLATLGVTTLADKLPDELSGGEAQRIAIARAIVAMPRLVLADEPTGQLDHAHAMQLVDTLFGWLDTSGAALVVATHDETLAARMQRVWRMSHGSLHLDEHGAA